LAIHYSTEGNGHPCYRILVRALKTAQFTSIYIGNRSHTYKVLAKYRGPRQGFFEALLADRAQQNVANCKDILRYRNSLTWIPRWLVASFGVL